VAVEWGQGRSGPNYEVKWQTFLKLVSAKELGGAMVHGQRMFGSAALNLCAVAAGQLDVYWVGFISFYAPWTRQRTSVCVKALIKRIRKVDPGRGTSQPGS
jgi:hypothetical protein